MTQAKSGDTVTVHYTGTLADNTVFDSSINREPLTFTLGQKQVIPGFEDGIIGMTVGETRSIKIPAEQAYGPRREEMMLQVPRNQFPPDSDPQVGQQFEIQQGNGQSVPVVVAAVAGEVVTLDANHPLAGQDLTFEIELLKIA
ncbi:MAG: peptidylprolyl isomerase [Chloroflexi bacterium]|nr:MAG: peptidylprolyl isomerase [Chloroflexota bacterium]